MIEMTNVSSAAMDWMSAVSSDDFLRLYLRALSIAEAGSEVGR